ncbi:hypothetical protein BD410DRAFT_791991 [Rickenella mellea]|uniref:F-box domain-containing protein n=1 Tax=Rickenella mellea TaxID=50990 RepID=A0A4Y7PYD2_9AGAM|nr:hypothetical protein BD410DRAFT_791991 [Rickenella mellea]
MPLVPSYIDLTSLATFCDAMERLRDIGGHMENVNVWYDGNPSNDPSNFLDELKVLKTHKELLRCLRKSLEKRIFRLQKPCNDISRHAGIKLLPSEVISKIFTLSLSEDRTCHSIPLTRVCQRFRTIAHQTPALWTNIHNSRRLWETEEYLRRSGSSALNIFCDGNDSLSDFLTRVASYSLRWSELHLTLTWPSSLEDYFEDQGIAHYRPILPLSNLNTIHHTFIDNAENTRDYNYFDTPWSLPSLKHYVAVNVMPIPRFLSGGVTHCDLQWERTALLRHDDENYTNFQSFIRTLGTMRALKNLRLSFIDILYSYEGHHWLATERLATEIPTIETFELEGRGGPAVEQAMDFLASHLNLPGVSDLSLITEMPNLNANQLLHNLSYSLLRLERLRRLHLTDYSSTDCDPLAQIIPHCDSLGYMTLRLPKAGLFSTQLEGFHGAVDMFANPISLKTLTLDNCHAVTRDELEGLVEMLRSGPNWNTFRRLEVTCCKLLTEDFLLAFEDETDGKLIWTTPL